VATRPLFPEETAQLVSVRARRRVFLGLGLLVFLAPFPLMAAAVILAPRQHVSPLGFALSLILLLTVAPCTGAIVALRATLELLAVRKELAAARLLRFKGRVVVPRLGRGPAAALVRSGDVKAGGVHTLDVLARSGRLVRVDGRRPRARLFLGIASTAALPETAKIAAQWLRPVKLQGGRDVLQGSRALGAEEETELSAHVTRFRKRSIVALSILAANVALFALVARSTWPTPLRIALCVAVSIGTLIDLSKISAILRLFFGLRRDLGAKKIIIVAIPLKEGAAETPPVEILVHSRLQWTHMGRPAPWRAGVYAPPRRY
jgi:hypothetical protein